MNIEMQALDAMFDDDTDAAREILDALDADSLDTLAEVALALSVVAAYMARERREPVVWGARLWWHARLTLLFALFCAGLSVILTIEGYFVAGWVAIAMAIGACVKHRWCHRGGRW